jgi:hypothetical protein
MKKTITRLCYGALIPDLTCLSTPAATNCVWQESPAPTPPFGPWFAAPAPPARRLGTQGPPCGCASTPFYPRSRGTSAGAAK